MATPMLITPSGQVTIPQDIRRQCGLLANTEVVFRVEQGRVMLEKAPQQQTPGAAAIQRLRQARLRTRLSTDELLALTRGEAG